MGRAHSRSVDLKNPGLISIPLGFLGVIVGSLLRRDRRAEQMWNEAYARQNTGLQVSKSAAGSENQTTFMWVCA